MAAMLRVTVSHLAIDTAMVGTADPKHPEDDLATTRKGALPDDVYQAVRELLRPLSVRRRGDWGRDAELAYA